MLRYHVAHGIVKQVVEVTSKESDVLTATLRSAFNIDVQETIAIQQWDADFQDWITVSNTEHLPDKCKLCIVIER